MSRPRKRYCPKGHDKDSPGGSIWFRVRTNKGTWTKARHCTLCYKARNRKTFYMNKELRKELLDFLGGIVFTISHRPTKDKAVELMEKIRKEEGNIDNGTKSTVSKPQ